MSDEPYHSELAQSEPDKYSTEYLRVAFSKDEQLELSKELANAMTRKKRTESRARQSSVEFKKELKTLDEKIEELSDWVASGYRLDNVECSIYFHEPKQGQKTVIRDDTGEVVNVALMSAEEMQLALQLKDPEEESANESTPETTDAGNDDEDEAEEASE